MKRNLYLRGNQPKTFSELYKRFFIEKEATDNVEGEEQCRKNASRSATDFVSLCMTYLPELKPMEIRKMVFSTVNKSYSWNRTKLLNSGFCHTVRRIVHNPIQYGITLDGIKKTFKTLKIKDHVCKKVKRIDISQCDKSIGRLS